MKIFVAILLLLFCGVDTTLAQLGYGPEAGIGMSTMRFAPAVYPIPFSKASVQPIVSGKIGGLIDVPLHRNIYFQAGLSFSRQGAVRDFSYHINDSFNETVHQTLLMNYFDLPLSVTYKTGMQGKGRFTVGLGATLSYITGGKDKLYDHLVYNDTLHLTNDVFRIVPGTSFKAFDAGVNITVAYELPTGLFFRLYYTAGFTDISMSTEIDKNRILGISAGYLFGKGRNINKEEDLIDKSYLPTE